MTPDSTPETESELRKRLPFAKGWPVLAGALVGVLVRLVFLGKPGGAFAPMGMAFVFFVPLAVGAITVYLAERTARRSVGYYIVSAALANALFVVGTLIILIEGLICAIVIVPVFAVYGSFGGLLMGAICRMTNWPKQATYSFAALPLLLGAIPTTALEDTSIRSVSRTVVVAAPPAHVWQQLLNAKDMQPEEMERGWMYRIGVPTPEFASTQTVNNDLVREIKMGKNIRFEQHSNDWEQDKRVRWTYRFTDDSFPKGALDDHVTIGGRYFDVLDTTYTLSPTSAGTELRTEMTFRVTTEFNWYANHVGDALVGNFAEVALDFYKARSER
ncbi:MAG: SRPBCC domain-containing protein [Betaproteobacteria bacterium]|nr:MAG: SRPBCC domain-containing protein [Betaproteobacteria bacterium]